MDTGFFSDIVRESLAERGCALLPGLGLLVMEEVPAYFSDKGFTINPPYQKIVFRAEKADDDSLVRRYAADNGMSVSRASDVIGECVASLENDLRVQRTVSLPGLGYLRMTHDGNIFFMEEEGLALCQGYDLLEPVSLRNLPALAAAQISVNTDIEPVAVQDQEIPDKMAGAQTLEPVSDSEPSGDSGPSGDSEPEAELDVEPQYDAEPEPDFEPASEKGGRESRVWLWVLLAVLLLVIAAFAVLAIGGRFFPEIVDRLLYTEEELDIIRAVL